MNKEQLEELKNEAQELGLKFSPNIGYDKLKAQVDAFYESQETSEKEIIAAVAANEESEGRKPAVISNGKKSMAVRARELYEAASKTRVVTIIDNDQRVNNQTTTCKANWSNLYYDMGTRIFPLNTPIEIPQGFIDVLKEVMIPHHTKDGKTGLSTTVMRPRYSISYEDSK